MKQYTIQKSTGKGTILVPSSKSHTLRALLFALMAKGKSTIHHYLPSPDTEAMLAAIQSLGAKVLLQDGSRIEIQGVNGTLQPAENVIDSGNSGQVLRFIGALAALSPTYTILTGDHSIRHNRPVKPMLDALKQLGAFAESARQDHLAPIIIKGPMLPGKTRLSGEDSQPVSALLMACSFLDKPTEILVDNPGEKPWILLTLHWMDRLGLRYANHNFERYIVEGRGSYSGFDISVPGDFSSAAFPIAAALVSNSEIELDNIDMQDIQGDKKLIDALILMGANIEINDAKKTLKVKKGSRLQGQRIDINDFIDAITILSVIACFAEGPTEIINASIARKKESDRIRCIAQELTKMGARLEEKPDGLVIFPSSLHGTEVFSHKDHRVAMSLAIAGLGASGITNVQDVECVKKTYPNFANDFQKLGFLIEEL
jgi:3-phosphoshikimate 1-carboxyvinyltransferase